MVEEEEEAAADGLTFIPFVVNKEQQRKEHEVLVAKARSYSAKRGHRLARNKKSNNLAPDSDLALRQPTRSEQNDICSAPVRQLARIPHNAQDQQARRRQSEAPESITRPVDRPLFGFLGSTIRFSDLEKMTLQYYKGQESLYAQSPILIFDIHTFVRDTLQRAVSQAPLLRCLTATTVVLKAQDQPGDVRLMKLGQEANLKALRTLRIALGTGTSDLLSLYFSIGHMCISSIRMGDMDSGLAHLKYLVSIRDDLDLKDPDQYTLACSILRYDMRYALESGKAPLTPSSWLAETCRSRKLCSDTPLAVSMLSTESTTSSPVSSRQLSPASNNIFDFKTQPTAAIQQQAISVTGLRQAADAGLLSEKVYEIVEESAIALNDAIELTSRLKPGTYLMGKLSTECMSTMHALASEWHFLQQDLNNRTPVADHRRPRAIDLYRSARQGLDPAAILSLQIHLVLQMETRRLVASTLDLLAKRLRRSLLRARIKIHQLSSAHVDGCIPIHRRLFLWLLLTGMLAASETSKGFHWFKREGILMCQGMELLCESQIEQALSVFITASSPLLSDYMRLARLFVRGKQSPSSTFAVA